MKALSLTQPWATLVALGVKRVETRGWFTHYRGPLAIHATGKCVAGPIGDFEVEKDNPRGSEPAYLIRGSGLRPYRIPLGAIVATCNLVDCLPAGLVFRDDEVRGWRRLRLGVYVFADPGQFVYGDLAPERYAWLLADIEPIRQPIPVRGHQGLWNWTDPR